MSVEQRHSWGKSVVTLKIIDSHFADGKTDVNVPLLQFLKLKMNNSVCIGKKAKRGWSGELPFYISRCGHHGYFVDYCHGWKKNFECPECLEMELSSKDLESMLEGKSIKIANPPSQLRSQKLSND